MRTHRFFVEEQLRNKKEVTLYEEEIIHQLKDVFRMRTGDKLILLDNSGFEYLSEISLIAKGKAEIKMLDRSASENMPERNREVWLFAALIKKDKYEWILEKGTEIGAAHFVPIVSERSEKKNLNLERGQKIIKEAAEQSGRGMLPVLHDIMDFKNIFETYSRENISYVAFHTGENIKPFDSSLRDSLRAGPTKIGVLVGPEGGWSDAEIDLLKEKKIPLYTLGNQILRAETAAIVASALLFFA